ncbi:class I SAM-dependent methyltransferase [bacterium]|nr:class I SAM-dependent methyltransferase [bacterium]|tara:strand:+ start:1716 stop:2381 length:666 start_codon:yes stop_codon:yes gene_type:complete
MGELKNFVTKLHQSSSRDYISRMNDDKIECMNVAKKYEEDYWDGDRRYGYGGYKYIPGWWANVAKSLIENYNLNNNSSLLDIGCGKGFLLLEIIKLLPNIKVWGLDISDHALNSAHQEIKPFLSKFDCRKYLNFQDNEFDLAISLGTLHNFKINELQIGLSEIERVSKKSYLMVESYRNNLELFNLQCWALTCESFYDKPSWVWLFSHFGYKGDYEFIYFE